MFRFTLGLTLGLVLGSAVSALAVAGWYDGEKFLDRSEEFQNGYVAGASDALDAIVDARVSMDFLNDKLKCLSTPDKTNRLADFRTWAARQMKNHLKSQAASIIIADACEP